MSNPELKKWLIENSSGVYRPAKDAAYLIDELEQRMNHWKSVAAYLASCHAATLASMPKSASKSDRRRHSEICRKAAAYLRGVGQPHQFRKIDDEVAASIIRCENAAEKYGLAESPNSTKP